LLIVEPLIRSYFFRPRRFQNGKEEENHKEKSNKKEESKEEKEKVDDRKCLTAVKPSTFVLMAFL